MPVAHEPIASSSAIEDTTVASVKKNKKGKKEEEVKPPQSDPSTPGCSVKHKKQNVAMLAHQRWKEQQASQGKDSQEPLDLPTPMQFLKWFILALLAVLALGQFVTGDVLYGYEGRWRDPRRWLPVPQKVFTPGELALYNGRDEHRPVYLSILGNVYDVTANRATYSPGGSYWFFSGTDASRAYVTGCFKHHITHDLRGLSEEDIESIRTWDKFFAENPKYFVSQG